MLKNSGENAGCRNPTVAKRKLIKPYSHLMWVEAYSYSHLLWAHGTVNLN
jgi:hypothetical protein